MVKCKHAMKNKTEMIKAAYWKILKIFYFE